MELGHHWGDGHAAFSVAWKLRHPGRGQSEFAETWRAWLALNPAAAGA
jgi:hypothetical protein